MPLEEMKLRVKRGRDNGGRKRGEGKGRKIGEAKDAEEERLTELSELQAVWCCCMKRRGNAA